MRLSIKSLKEAFLTECNRASNMQLGRAFFQNFEIAHFINAAYMQCLNDRLRLFDERYIPSDKRLQEQPDKAPFPASMRLLLDFGTLYTSTGLLFNTKITFDNLDVSTCGENSKVFKIPHTIPYQDRAAGDDVYENKTVEVPYFVNVNLFEYNSTGKKVASMLCRPINPVDITRMSLFYQDDKYMPYIYYRIRPVIERDASNGKYKEDFFIELSYKEQGGANSQTYIMADMIRWPKPYSEKDIAQESPSVYFETMFGYEVAQRAAAIAMESLGASRAQSLQRVSAESAPS